MTNDEQIDALIEAGEKADINEEPLAFVDRDESGYAVSTENLYIGKFFDNDFAHFFETSYNAREAIKQLKEERDRYREALEVIANCRLHPFQDRDCLKYTAQEALKENEE